MVSMDKASVRALQGSKGSGFRGPDLKLFVRDVRDHEGRKLRITVRSWSTVKDLKDKIHQVIDEPVNALHIYFGPLLTSGKELPNHRSLHDVGIYRSGETLLLDVQGHSSSLSSAKSADICISSSVVDATPKLLVKLIDQSRSALSHGLKPEFLLDGSGGSYFLHDSRKRRIGVFKPADEEPYAENNPRGYLPQPGQGMFLRDGVIPGEGCIREVAAFMLDHGGFCEVPMTTLVEARHPSFNTDGARLKVAEGGASIGAHSISNNHSSSSSMKKKVGSFQEFVPSECSMDDLGHGMLSVDEVHKIAILDIRLMNADRNAANLLCRRRSDNSVELVPIDHGFCLRSVADVSWMDWCWLDWPQTKQPMSQKTKEYILSLDIEKDSRLLKERLNLCHKALDYFCASSSILKAGVNLGLTLYDIAIMCCRNDTLGEVPSKLEVLFSMASKLAQSAIENGYHHAAASKALQAHLTPKESVLPSGVPKSVSAIDFSQLSKATVVFSAEHKPGVPGMIQSSASDSSSDTEMEKEEYDEGCDEWAANWAEGPLDRRFSLLDTKPRSASIESDTSSDSDLEGFWPPGSAPESSIPLSDDESTSWSPPSSPKNILDISASSILSGMHKAYNPIAQTGRRSSIVFSDFEEVGTTKKPIQKRSPAKVSFADHAGSDDKDSELDVRFKHSNSDVVGSLASLAMRPPENPMKRSQSYSALSSAKPEAPASEDDKTKEPTVDQEQYREYFLKFVDLVIVLETTAAARQVN